VIELSELTHRAVKQKSQNATQSPYQSPRSKQSNIVFRNCLNCPELLNFQFHNHILRSIVNSNMFILIQKHSLLQPMVFSTWTLR